MVRFQIPDSDLYMIDYSNCLKSPDSRFQIPDCWSQTTFMFSDSRFQIQIDYGNGLKSPDSIFHIPDSRLLVSNYLLSGQIPDSRFRLIMATVSSHQVPDSRLSLSQSTLSYEIPDSRFRLTVATVSTHQISHFRFQIDSHHLL